MSVTPKSARKEKQSNVDNKKKPAGSLKKTAEKQEVIPKSTDGHKPDLTVFEDSYNPMKVESEWYSWWEHNGFFRPQGDGKVFTIIQPPPNVTGELHLGHALTSSIEDAITRHRRMCGEHAVWVPGTDHAGIATQTRVEKKIFDESGRTRNQISREEFLEAARVWVDSKSGTILSQLRDMGSSLDWDMKFYTLDEKRNVAVNKAFVTLFDKGLVYRKERLVNWDCALQTAISDAEVEYITLTERTLLKVPNHKFPKYPFGVMTHFYYQIADENGNPTNEKLEIATTRLETMLGDEAVAIHPEDPRYLHLHGKSVYHPFRKITIPIVCDSILVDMNFGTGVVKVTPAHDPNDFEVGLRHKLPFTSIFTKDGKINDISPEFEGLPRFDARKEIANKMKEMGLWKEERNHEMRLGITQRGSDIVEQFITFQWFVDTTNMAARAIKAVDDGSLKIIPEEFVIDWKGWHENIRPWCISRQLMWGHRIPAYRVFINGELQAGDKEWVSATSETEAIQKASKLTGAVAEQITVKQDDDVLDTWFSSALLPFSAVGWPDNEDLLNKYFPNSVLETGWDILTFWVSRMVMMSLELTDRVPFHTVLLHPLVRDAQGRKMSKSLGNVIDPRHIINGVDLEYLVGEIEKSTLDPKEKAIAIKGVESDYEHGIPQCGTDAMRLALCSFAGANRTANLNLSVIIGFRNFCNKMWNAVRFARGYFDDYVPQIELNEEPLEDHDKWVLQRLSLAIKAATEGLINFKMADAISTMTHFFQDEFCSIYLEAVKASYKKFSEKGKPLKFEKHTIDVLYECIESSLRMFHPFMPYVTEDLWQRLPRRFNTETIMFAPFPLLNERWLGFNTKSVETSLVVLNLIRSHKKNLDITKNSITIVVKKAEGSFEPIELSNAVVSIYGDVTIMPESVCIEEYLLIPNESPVLDVFVKIDENSNPLKVVEKYMKRISSEDDPKYFDITFKHIEESLNIIGTKDLSSYSVEKLMSEIFPGYSTLIRKYEKYAQKFGQKLPKDKIFAFSFIINYLIIPLFQTIDDSECKALFNHKMKQILNLLRIGASDPIFGSIPQDLFFEVAVAEKNQFIILNNKRKNRDQVVLDLETRAKEAISLLNGSQITQFILHDSYCLLTLLILRILRAEKVELKTDFIIYETNQVAHEFNEIISKIFNFETVSIIPRIGSINLWLNQPTPSSFIYINLLAQGDNISEEYNSLYHYIAQNSLPLMLTCSLKGLYKKEETDSSLFATNFKKIKDQVINGETIPNNGYKLFITLLNTIDPIILNKIDPESYIDTPIESSSHRLIVKRRSTVHTFILCPLK